MSWTQHAREKMGARAPSARARRSTLAPAEAAMYNTHVPIYISARYTLANMGVGAAKTSSDLRDEGWIPCVWSVWEGPADPPPPHKRRRLRLSIAASASAPPASNPPAAGPRVTPAAGEAAAGGAGGVGPPHLNASSAEKGIQNSSSTVRCFGSKLLSETMKMRAPSRERSHRAA